MIFVDCRPFPTSSPHSNQVDAGDALGFLLSLLQHPSLVSASDRLKSSPVRGASEWIGSGGKHVYVFQREYATVDPALVQFIGTDEATTCVGIAIRSRATGMTSVAHMDSPEVVDSGLIQMLSLVVVSDEDASFDVHLVGGFDDANASGKSRGLKKPPGYSLPLCSKLIRALRASREKFNICTLCILEHNTRRGANRESFPIFDGFVLETSSGSIMPALFDKNSRCPDEIVRRLRITVSYEDPSCRGKLLETYDTKHDKFKIAACSWSPGWASWASSMLRLSDSKLLLESSTSPSAENPDFIENQRRTYNYLINHPDWRQTFSRRSPRVFERTADGGWSRCAS